MQFNCFRYLDAHGSCRDTIHAATPPSPWINPNPSGCIRSTYSHLISITQCHLTTMISGSYTRRKTPSWCLGPEKQNILCKNILTKFLSSFFEINRTIFTTCKRKNTKMYSAAREKAIFTDLSGPRGELVQAAAKYPALPEIQTKVSRHPELN